MEEVKLDVQIREKVGRRNVKAVRREDFVPAIVYGEKRKPTAIKVDRRTYEKIVRQNQGQSIVFHLNVMEGEKKLRDYSAIVKEEQFHPLKDSLVHIDFNRISLKKELEIEVPVVVKGEAIGVKRDGGSVDQQMRELDIVCLPTNIPSNLEVDITELEIGDAIHVSDIKLPEGVTTKHDAESIIVTIVPPMRDEEEGAEGEDAEQEPEVTKEKKPKEEKSEEEKKEESK